MTKCIVFNCQNVPFQGELCAQCHQYLKTGKIGSTQSFLSVVLVAHDEVVSQIRNNSARSTIEEDSNQALVMLRRHLVGFEEDKRGN